MRQRRMILLWVAAVLMVVMTGCEKKQPVMEIREIWRNESVSVEGILATYP